ncbi:MAG: DUF3887 domain-containing protein [Theionarchaea archaeon]|nr:DUF3887 domain-containing protein [Theionarchaea archaeon]
MVIKNYSKCALAFSLTLLVLSGCIGQEEVLEGEEREQWINIATPIAENILQSINNNDHQGFIKDFSEEMKNAFPLQEFTELRETLESKIGKYISSTPTRVTEQGGFIAVIFTAKFEKEDNVTVRVVFEKGDETHKVSGLWFDSPKLRE